MFSKRLLANTRGENGEETTKDPRNPFTPCPFAAWASLSDRVSIWKPYRKQRKTGLPRTAFRADSNALITPQNMKNMKLDVNS